MRTLTCAAALAAIGAPLLLAACGGGGGGGGGSGSSGPPAGHRALTHAGTADPAATQTAIGAAGQEDPQLGSVYQQVSTSEATSATFNGSRVGLTVGSTLNLNSEDHSLGSTRISTPVAGHTGRSWGLARTTATSLSGAAVFVSWDSENTADWLAGGYWLHAIGDPAAGTVSSVEAGAFVDGPEFEDRGTNPLPSSGTATYSGVAGGIYAYGNPAGNVAVGEVLGTVRLTADFGAGTVGGAISGIGGAAITLEPAGYTATGRIGQLTAGNVDLTVNGVTYDNAGKWGGRFSNKDHNGQPRLVAGTAGADWTESNGNRGSFVGAFVAQKE